MAQFNLPGSGFMPGNSFTQNNGYVQQPNQLQQQQRNANSNNVNNTNIVWVQGIEGAKAYPLPPGSAISLWDTEQNVVYIKIVDLAGVPLPIRVFDYTERVVSQQQSDDKSYVTEEKLNEILDEKFASFAQSFKNKNKKNM